LKKAPECVRWYSGSSTAETLADRIARGPIPLDEALPIVGGLTGKSAVVSHSCLNEGLCHREAPFRRCPQVAD
jgi:hypothetical protein